MRSSKLKGVFQHRLLSTFRVTSGTVFLGLTILLFQNCGPGGFQVNSKPSIEVSSSGSSISPAADPTLNPLPNSVPPNVPSAGSSEFTPPFAPVSTKTVCSSGCDFQLLSAALAAAVDFELIQVKGGDYVDCAEINRSHIWIKGIGGVLPRFRDKTCGGKAILITNGDDITLENLEFSGMMVADHNGAGIRVQSTKVTVRNCYFHDGQQGILTYSPPGEVGSLTVQNSHFARLGYEGYEHGMYIGRFGSFSLKNSVVEQAKHGHEVKTRAAKSVIECNKILGGYDSNYSDSYNIDTPNGGEVHILNNLIAQGPYQDNPTMVTFGPEGLSHAINTLEMVGNLMINDLNRTSSFLNIFNRPTGPSTIKDNIFIGSGTTIGGDSSGVAVNNNKVYPDRNSAGVYSQFPAPSACREPIGLVPFQ